MVRFARPEDKPALKELWHICFNDPAPFEDWFFSERFLPEYCALEEDGGRIVACAHTLPNHICVRNTLLSSAMLTGVSTLPEYRGRGCMRRVMSLLVNMLRDRGIVLMPFKPAELEMYYFLGCYPVSSSQYVTLEAGAKRPQGDLTEADIGENCAALYESYMRFSSRYSGSIHRSYADFVLKMRDYLSVGAKCATVMAGRAAQGYCIYFETQDEIYGEEFTAADNAAYQPLFEAMAARSLGKKLTIRMASDVRFNFGQAKSVTVPKSVLGVLDAPALLRALDLEGFTVQIKDGIIAQNAGVYDISGQRTNAAPQLCLEAGRLGQWAVGFETLAELEREGYAQFLDREAALKLDALLPKRPCFIVEEY